MPVSSHHDHGDPLGHLVAGSRLVDLTHRLTPEMPVWPTHPHFCQSVVESYRTGAPSYLNSIEMSEHTGTHFDAPVHFIDGAASIDESLIERFFGRLVKIDATSTAPRASVTARDIAEWEREHVDIRAGDAVLFHFGWDRFWHDAPESSRFLKDWPGLARDACELLVDRGVRIVGGDCLSIDAFGAAGFPAHRALLGAGILIGENFANLGLLPPASSVATLPLPIAGGSGAPLRAVAFVPR